MAWHTWEMGFYNDVILPHCIELSCGSKQFDPARDEACALLSGTVLEIGFGTGLNLPHMPRAVTRVLGVEPSERARHMAAKRVVQARCTVEFLGLDAQAIQAESAIADAALSTFTLCTIPDIERALREVKRILKPGGRLFFLEHGRAPDAGVARWQDRLDGLQQKIAGGCHLNRDIPALIRAAGFRLESLDAAYAPRMPRTHGYLFSGAAAAA